MDQFHWTTWFFEYLKNLQNYIILNMILKFQLFFRAWAINISSFLFIHNLFVIMLFKIETVLKVKYFLTIRNVSRTQILKIFNSSGFWCRGTRLATHKCNEHTSIHMIYLHSNMQVKRLNAIARVFNIIL